MEFQPFSKYLKHNLTVLVCLCSLLLIYSKAQAVEQKASFEIEDCDELVVLKIITLFDVTSSNSTLFYNQKFKIVKTLRHLNVMTEGRIRAYALFAFHRLPHLLSPLNGHESNNVEKIINEIGQLKPKKKNVESSPAKALHAVIQHIKATEYNFPVTSKQSKIIVFLVYDGHNTDSITDTLEAAKLARSEVDVFVVSGSDSPNIPVLVSYTQKRQKIFAAPEDITLFYDALNKKVGICFEDSIYVTKPLKNNFEVTSPTNSNDLVDNKIPMNDCPSNKVDLLLIIDTGGSIVNSFERERKLALDLINSLDKTAFDDRLKLGLIQIASNNKVILPLDKNRSPAEINNTINSILYTGENTRIADIVHVAAQQLKMFKRGNALTVFVLISDGNGQEYWENAQAAGKYLQETGAKIFAATASVDFNLEELVLYAGSYSRVFVGLNHKEFVPTVSSLINNCVSQSQNVEKTNANEAVQKFNTKPFDVKTVRNKLSDKFKNGTQTYNKFVDKSNSFQEKFITTESNTPVLTDTTTVAKLSQTIAVKLTTITTEPTTILEQNTNTAVKKIEEVFSLPSADTKIIRDFVIAEEKEHGVVFKEKSIDHKNLEKIQQHFDSVAPTSSEGIAHTARRLQAIRNLSTIPEDCLTDVVFVIDQSYLNNNFDFSKQLNLLTELVNKIDASDIESKKVRLAAITFGQDNASEISFDSINTKKEFINKIQNVKPNKFRSSFVKGIQHLNKEVKLRRRKTARLIVIVSWNGLNGRDSEVELRQATNSLLSIPKSDIYSVTLNPHNNLNRLRDVSAGNKWHVYVNARVSRFVEQAGQALIACTLPPSRDMKSLSNHDATEDNLVNEIDKHQPLSSVERVEHLQIVAKQVMKFENCNQDFIDFVLVLDLTNKTQGANASDQFDRLVTEERRAAQDVLKQGNEKDFQKRVRFSLITVHEEFARTLILLKNSISLDDALFGIDQIDLVNVKAEKKKFNFTTILSNDVHKFHRAKARLVFVVITELTLNNTQKHLLKDIAQFFKKIGKSDAIKPSILAYSLQNDIFGEMNEKSGGFRILKDRKVGSGYQRFITKANSQIFRCKSYGQSQNEESVLQHLSNNPNSKHLRSVNLPLADLVISDASLNIAPKKLVKIKTTRQEDISLTVTPKVEIGTTATRFTHPTVVFDLNENHPTVSFRNDECTVDLIFIIDTSQSVSENFQKQLQFGVDLVKRLPNEDFEQRVQVSAVSFNSKAQLEFGFGTRIQKASVLDALLAIEHSGGSTSAVSGIELAIKEIKKKHRPSARLMVVLISDGNSQDSWDRVVDSAQSLRSVKADVYAVTVNHDYFFRELQLYTGNKWFVYIDARIYQFLNEAEMSLVECKSPFVPASLKKSLVKSSIQSNLAFTGTTQSTLKQNKCEEDLVDLLFVLDTSKNFENKFYSEKNFALDLIKVIPEQNFKHRINVALVTFSSKGILQFGFGISERRRRNDILYEIERIEFTDGQTSLVAGAETAVVELQSSRRRSNARLVTIFVSNGITQDELPNVQTAAKRFHQIVGNLKDIYAFTLSSNYSAEKLKEFTGNASNIYDNKRVNHFIQDVGKSIIRCPKYDSSFVEVTLPPNVQVEVLQLSPLSSDNHSKNKNKSGDVSFKNDFARRDEQPIDGSLVPKDLSTSLKSETEKCKFVKMDLIIILDASTSRENVFEHQRELALSLIERLPISKDGIHVATGINSFTNVPTLRQTLGLGRDRNMVRKVIEDIKYHGGSTLTAQAVELAVQDLERGKRPDAIQVVVLMNDGMSQDLWERVLSSSKRLASTGAERFGVALGSEVDLRELLHYIGNENRIYRDGSTERFLNDIVSLLNNGVKDCSFKKEVEPSSIDDEKFDFQTDACAKPQMDLVVLFDNSENTPNQINSRLNSNRYLVLDVLGSLPLATQVKLSVITFGSESKLIHKFSDPQTRESVFKRIEGIQPVKGQPSYVKATQLGLEYYNKNHRSEARGFFLYVGNGENVADSTDLRKDASNALKNTKDITAHAIDSGKSVNFQTLSAYTGSLKRVYNYDRNSEFAKVLLDFAMAATDCKTPIKNDEKILLNSPESSLDNSPNSINRDIAAQGINENDKKLFGEIRDDSQKSFFKSEKPAIKAKPQEILPPKINKKEKTNEFRSDLQKSFVNIKNPKNQSIEVPIITPRIIIPFIATRPTKIFSTKAPRNEFTKKNTEQNFRTTSLRTTSTRIQKGRTAKPLVFQNTFRPSTISSLKPKFFLQNNLQKKIELQLQSRFVNRLETIFSPTPQRVRVLENQKKFTTISSMTPSSVSHLQLRKKNTLHNVAIANGNQSQKSGFNKTTDLGQRRSFRFRTTTIAPSSTLKISKLIETSKTPSFTTVRPRRQFSTIPFERNLFKDEDSKPFQPGCLIDLIIIIDCSGSVEETFEHQKRIANDIITSLRVGENNTRVALIKFAGSNKVRTLYSFDRKQSKGRILNALNEISHTSGVTAIHSALLHAITEYTPLKGARPGIAEPLVIIFTDGFGQHEVKEEAELLRRLIPTLYAVAINHDFPISRSELKLITGDSRHVFTDSNIGELHKNLRKKFRTC